MAKKKAAPKRGKPVVAAVSASLTGQGFSEREPQRAEQLEKAMNDAYVEGTKKGISDPEKLLKLKLKARNDFLANEK